MGKKSKKKPRGHQDEPPATPLQKSKNSHKKQKCKASRELSAFELRCLSSSGYSPRLSIDIEDISKKQTKSKKSKKESQTKMKKFKTLKDTPGQDVQNNSHDTETTGLGSPLSIKQEKASQKIGTPLKRSKKRKNKSSILDSKHGTEKRLKLKSNTGTSAIEDQFQNQTKNDSDVSERFHSSFMEDRLNFEDDNQSQNCFKMASSNKVLIVLKNKPVGIKGKVTIEKLCGSVEILGYRLSSNYKNLSLFSPSSHSYLLIEPTFSSYEEDTNNNQQEHEVRKVVKEYLKKEDSQKVEEFTLRIGSVHAVIVLSKCHSTACDFVTNWWPFYDLFSCTTERDVEGIIGCKIITDVLEDDQNATNITEEFIAVKSRIYNLTLNEAKPPVVVLCGGKNVGKSTMARYLLNSCLNRYEKVAFLECDPGQTEFSPSGCVSLHVAHEPLLGPPMTHLQNAHSQCYLGLLTPSDHPDYYVQCLHYVFNSYDALNLPLIVNTMGWNKGLGLQLLVDTIRLVRPDLVVQLETSQQHRNMPDISPQYIQDNPGWVDSRIGSALPDFKSYNHEHLKVSSTVKTSTRDRFGAPDYRAMTLLSYFSRCFPHSQQVFNIGAVTPYKVPWGSVAVHMCHEAVPNSQILYALNASVVALASVDPQKIYSLKSDDSLPKYLTEEPICECLGFGIVRSIDPEEKMFYIITPEPADRLEKVNCLLRGALELPPQIILQQEGNVIPYIDAPNETVGTSSIKRRRHLQRPTSPGNRAKTQNPP